MKLPDLLTFKRVLVALWLVFFAGLFPAFAINQKYPYPLGEHILASILQTQKHTEASLLLLTQNLKWFEQEMHKLPGPIQAEIQHLRIRLAGDVAQSSARQLGEAEAAFAATGSWKPGRDMDIVYMGKNGDAAAQSIARNYEAQSAHILAMAGSDPILKSYSGDIPRSLTADSLAVCTTELPNYGYEDLKKAYNQAKQALARGESNEEVLAILRKDIQQAMSNNMTAHFAAQANPDYYAGATGQKWFRENYLDKPDKMRTFMQNDSGNWVLKPGGIQAVPAEIVERLGFGSMGGSGVKFSKIASDYALFFSHMHGGPSDNAKYVLRVWQEMGLNAIQDLSDAEVKMLAAAKAASAKPTRATEILAAAGMSPEDFNKNMSRILLNWTEAQLVRDMDRLVAELGSSSAKTVDELDKMLRQAKTAMNLNELTAGLEKLKSAPKEVQLHLIERLKTKFGSTPAGMAAVNFVMRNLELLDDTGGELTRRLATMLKDMNKISQEDADALLRGEPASDAAQAQVRRARQEIAALSAGGMVEFDDALDLDRLMEDWRQAKPDALLQSPSAELKVTLEELRSADEARLKELGWLDDEIVAHRRVLDKMHKDAMRKLGQKLEPRLVKGGVSLRNFQQKIRGLLFNPDYAQLGDANSSVGVFDAVVGVANGLYSTYDILNNQRLSPADETLALENAWVTAIPIVGDFAQGLITGSQAVYEGDKGKALEAGLWITIGTMGCVPGGQLPAVVLGIGLATKPIVVGTYDARQAQNLVQAWVESGQWSQDKPRKLLGLYGRAPGDTGVAHDIVYSELLTDKAKTPYLSTRLGDISITQSIRDYAEKYVIPQYPTVKLLREALLSVYPDFNDQEWDDEFSASIKIDREGGKGSKILFRSYFQARGKALVQTINHLKQWSEDEMRALKDYDAEVARLRDELRALERDLQASNLVSNADASVQAYSKIVANLWEQESLPLARLRIYEHYVNTYRTIDGKLRRVLDILREASNPFMPPGWHLTGYPELDRDRVDALSASMENGRKAVLGDIENTLKEFGIRSTRYNKDNACHKAAFDTLAPLRYKYAFTEFMALYFQALAESSSAWSSAYDTAKARYQESRAQALRNIGSNLQSAPQVMLLMEQKAMTDAFMSFVAAVPYALASGEVTLYQTAARDYALRQYSAGLAYQNANGASGKAGRDLADCLQAALEIDLQLSNAQPEAGTDVTASFRLAKGETHADVVWDWKLEGGLVKKSAAPGELLLTVNGPGKLTVFLRDWYNGNTGKYGKVLASASADIEAGLPSDIKVFTSGPSQITLGSSANYYASVDAKAGVAQELLANARIEWQLDGQPATGSSGGLRLSPTRAGHYSVVAVATLTDKGKKRTLATSRTVALQVLDGTEKDGAGDHNLRDKPDAGQPTDQAPSSCSYSYADWGECSRATKKQTRSVTATLPSGCIEKSKPILEQACTPPPSEEEKKNRYLNCLCRCSSNWAGHIGVWYDPEGKTVPECKSSGPCIGGIGAFGCSSRHFFNSSSECAKGCWEGAYGKGSYAADDASKVAKEENKKFKKPLTVKLSASKNPADFGDVVDLTAQASEGTGGYQWRWDGCAKDAKNNTAKVLHSHSCKPCQASVTVTDSDGESATDSLTVQCTELTVRLTQESPKDNRLPLGSSAKFLAEVMSGTQAAAGRFTYLWEHNPDVGFGDPKNPSYETTGGAQSRNTAHFGKLGNMPVWVSVLKEIDGHKTTVGKSEQIVTEVVKPRLTLNAEPKDAMVGQEVRLTVQEDPKMSDDLLSFWWEISGEANNPGAVPNVPNKRAYSFKSRSDKPVTVTVHAKAKDGGDDLGQEKLTLQARKPTIVVTGPKIAGPAPRIWKEGVGLVSVERQVAEDQRVEFSASVTPEVKQDLRYQWTVKPEGCSLSAPSSRVTGVTCARTGSYALTAAVRNSDGAELGQGEGSLSVSVSQSDIKKGQQKDELAKKLEQVRALWRQGRVEDALALLASVTRTEPQMAAPLIQQFGQELKQLGNTALQALDAKTAVKRLEQAASLLPGDTDIRQQLLRAQQLMQQQVQALQFLESTKANLSRGVPADAQGLSNLLAELKQRESVFPAADAQRAQFAALAASLQQKQLQAQQQAAVCEAKWTEGKTLYEARKLPEALAKFKENLICAPGRQERSAYVAQLEQAIKTQQAQLATAKRLRDEGAALQAQSQLPQAIAKYRESLKWVADPKLEQHILELERQAQQTQQAQQKSVLAQKLRAEGAALQQQNQITQAVAKYRESLTLVPDPALEAHIAQLQSASNAQQAQQQRVAQAKQLREQGAALQQQNQIPQAIAKYRESLAFVPDPALQTHIDALQTQWEAQQAQQAQQQQVAQARQLREEGAALQQRNQIAEAIDKYRQSLALVPDAALEAHIRHLQTALAPQAPQTAPTTHAVPAVTAVPAAAAHARVLFDNGNISGVSNPPTQPTQVRFASPVTVTKLNNYHWNHGRGTARAGSIGLRDASGRLFGPWPAKGDVGQGNVPNANWSAYPNVTLPAGLYTVVDSDPSTWAQNSGSKGAGHTRIEGVGSAGVGVTSGAGAMPSASVAPPVASSKPSAGQLDGRWSGSFSGDGEGSLRLTLRGSAVQGTLSGKVDGDPVSATVSGSVDSHGQLRLKVKGTVSWTLSGGSSSGETPFGGELTGTAQGAQASGRWTARSVDGDDQRSGTWRATR